MVSHSNELEENEKPPSHSPVLNNEIIILVVIITEEFLPILSLNEEI